jgi:hypothetical protein
MILKRMAVAALMAGSSEVRDALAPSMRKFEVELPAIF